MQSDNYGTEQPTAPETGFPAPEDNPWAPAGDLIGPGTPGKGPALWLVALVAFGVGGLLFGQQELAAMVALAGLFVVAQAADLDAGWAPVHYLLSWVVPLGGGAAFTMLGVGILGSDIVPALRPWAVGVSWAGAVVSASTALRPVSDTLERLFFRAPPSHSLRLGARLTLLGLLFAVPGWFAFRYLLDSLMNEPGPLLERVSLGGQLIGYVLLALASVGFMVRRDLAATLERLGIRPLAREHLAIIALGVVALWGLNASADWLQHTVFPDLWEHDHRMNEAIARGLGPGEVILLGMSAGIGEELTLRGALQPKLGLLLTSLLFAALHVQYSWFGVGVIFLLGLTLGAIRDRTSTSVAICVHAVYDVLAVFSV